MQPLPHSLWQKLDEIHHQMGVRFDECVVNVLPDFPAEFLPKSILDKTQENWMEVAKRTLRSKTISTAESMSEATMWKKFAEYRRESKMRFDRAAAMYVQCLAFLFSLCGRSVANKRSVSDLEQLFKSGNNLEDVLLSVIHHVRLMVTHARTQRRRARKVQSFCAGSFGD